MSIGNLFSSPTVDDPPQTANFGADYQGGHQDYFGQHEDQYDQQANAGFLGAQQGLGALGTANKQYDAIAAGHYNSQAAQQLQMGQQQNNMAAAAQAASARGGAINQLAASDQAARSAALSQQGTNAQAAYVRSGEQMQGLAGMASTAGAMGQQGNAMYQGASANQTAMQGQENQIQLGQLQSQTAIDDAEIGGASQFQSTYGGAAVGAVAGLAAGAVGLL